MAEVADVVVVGGGIAGASLGYALASEGLGVTILESSVEYPDRVRGESMQAWGVKEARDLGVERILVDGGAHVAPVWKQHVEGVGEAATLPMSMMVEGIPGTLNMRHPDACQALVDVASSAGANVVRGVQDVTVEPGRTVSITYSSGGTHEVTAPLVVGADGRASTVRRQAGITLQHQEPTNYIAGLLVDRLDGVPDDHDVTISEGDQFLLVFHQGNGRARLYVCSGLSGQHRFAGADATRRFLEAWNPSCYPHSALVAAAVPAGPCATYPGDDTWTDQPFAEGVVLIGDAAGYNDPIIGQGLSIALRDARIVRDLILEGACQPSDFAPYGRERFDRMERLRLMADVISVANVEDADNRPARRAFFGEKMATMDPDMFPLASGIFTGPETVPDELVDARILDRIRNAQ
jgi:2-polyprenyl-6-methoxyphenol hydroxylase-like FAD-dependent oxidoreductase